MQDLVSQFLVKIRQTGTVLTQGHEMRQYEDRAYEIFLMELEEKSREEAIRQLFYHHRIGLYDIWRLIKRHQEMPKKEAMKIAIRAIGIQELLDFKP